MSLPRDCQDSNYQTGQVPVQHFKIQISKTGYLRLATSYPQGDTTTDEGGKADNNHRYGSV